MSNLCNLLVTLYRCPVCRKFYYRDPITKKEFKYRGSFHRDDAPKINNDICNDCLDDVFRPRPGKRK